MVEFPILLQAGAAVAVMSDSSDGDCGWGGATSGERSAFLRRAGLPADRLTAVRQCHGSAVLTVGEDAAGLGAVDRESAVGDADGLVTVARGIPLGITIADCVPLLIVAPGAIAAVHAGREGTALGIGKHAVATLCAAARQEPSSLRALIGPSAGPCCYEVSPEMRSDWCGAGGAALGNHLDLWETNRLQLAAAGVPESQICIDGRCTICDRAFHSYRGGAATARNLAVLML